jgi:hypothetical protein
MNRAKLVLAVAVSLGAAFLSGCLFVQAPPTGIVEGYVTDHLSGEPVAGAKVVAYPLGGDLPEYWVGSDYYGPFGTTNGNGYYKLVLPKGMYALEFRKDGHATSRVEGVQVASTARVDTVLKPVANPNWSLTPPTVTITGISEGSSIPAAPLSIKIDARGPNDIRVIYAAFGKTPGAAFLTAPRPVYSQTYTTGTFTIDPRTFGVSGDTTFEVVVYDMNENRTHVIYRVHVAPAADFPGIRPPRPPTGWVIFGFIPARPAMAVTLSRKVGFYGEALEPLAAPPGGNLYVELRWTVSLDDGTITGYRIYRRLEGEADFRLIYTVNRGTTLYRDSTPDLAVDRTAYYRIVAFRGATESEPLEASTTPIPMWDVKLISPAEEATDVSLTPTFTWEAVPVVGTRRLYRARIWDTPQGGFVVTSGDIFDVTSWAFTGIPGGPFERLQPHRMYQWNIMAAIAFDDPKSAVSVAVNQMYAAFPTLVHPEARAFTTKDW